MWCCPLAEIFLISSDKSVVVVVIFSPLILRRDHESIEMVRRGLGLALRSEMAGLERRAGCPVKSSPKSTCREWNPGARTDILE